MLNTFDASPFFSICYTSIQNKTKGRIVYQQLRLLPRALFPDFGGAGKSALGTRLSLSGASGF